MLAIFIANPCAKAVLPTPGSPIKQGLFLDLLFKIWIILSISLLLPITLSNSLFFAFWVKLVPYESKNFFFFFFVLEDFFCCLELLESDSLSLLLLLGVISPANNESKGILFLSIESSSISFGSMPRLTKFKDSKFKFLDKSLKRDSNWLDILFGSILLFKMLFCLAITSNGSIPFFFAQSKHKPFKDSFPSLSVEFMNMIAVFFLHSEQIIN